MLEYYHDVCGQQVSNEHQPDVNLIGKEGDVTELGKLVQLVLGCAISCEKNDEQIQQIMTMEESVQHVLMTDIQELWLEEKLTIQEETHPLEEKLSCCDCEEAAAITGKKLLLLQRQMAQLQEENYRLETSPDDMRMRGEVLESEVVKLQHHNKELTSLAQEAQNLKDEMDILWHSSDRVSQLEVLVETYKQKLENLGDLRRQVHLLEECNAMYIQRNCELEDELCRASAVRTQLNAYKRQVHELHKKYSGEAIKAEKWQLEYNKVHEKYDILLKEKERLISEGDALRETNDELECAQVYQHCLTQAGNMHDNSGAVGSLAAEITDTEFKEMVIHPQSENKMQCVQEETYRQRLLEVQAELEKTQHSKNALEAQNRLNQQEISELRSQVKGLQKALQEQGSKTEPASLLRKKLEEHTEKCHEAYSHLQKKRQVIDDLQHKANNNMPKKKDELQCGFM